MKRKHIILIGLAAVSLASCSDFLDVEAPSAIDKAVVFNDQAEANKALNGVYASLLTGDSYGNNYLSSLQLNSDVDMAANDNEQAGKSNYARFDCTSEGGEINKFWTAEYKTIEYANDFVYGIEHSPVYWVGVEPAERDANIMQMYGEAKCIRAMAYHDLVTYFGDIPFDFTTTTAREDVQVMPVKDRTAICDTLIKDLISVLDAGYLKPASAVTVERCNREFAQALIARIALTAGGYSLRPGDDNNSYGIMKRPDNYKDYYATARKYAKQVIDDGQHSLTQSYRQVFISECNRQVVNNDDPIFEIPFTTGANGSIGYIQGPSSSFYNNKTVSPNEWGKTSGSVRVSFFYPYLFDEADVRGSYVVGRWKYTSKLLTLKDANNKDYQEERCYPELLNDYTYYNNKWSKLWATIPFMANNSEGSTGINFPYMRYTDVLLMFAEADNEVNDGPTPDALDALQQVRDRAFPDVPPGYAPFYDDTSSKEGFLKTVLHERALEFAGENMRWKDLVRNNMYAENIIYDYFRYYSLAESVGGVDTNASFEQIQNHDGIVDYLEKYKTKKYYSGLPTDNKSYVKVPNPNDIDVYPNTMLDILEISDVKTDNCPIDVAFCEKWWNQDGYPSNQILYSFFGYIRGDNQGSQHHLVTGYGSSEPFELDQVDTRIAAGTLPPVRYIFPYPAAAIQRSAGAYVNKYGYK